MIRVTRPYDTNSTIAKPRRSSGATEAFSINKEAKSGVEQVDASPESGMLGVLIALQGGEQHPDNDIVEWSHQALDVLEQLRDGLLLGSFDGNSIKALSDQIENSMDATLDPVLADLQAQILLRARVELAKVERDTMSDQDSVLELGKV